MAIDWVPVHVKGRETVEAGAGKKAGAWVVETPTRRYGRMTWWVTKEPPYVIKAVLEVPEKEAAGDSGRYHYLHDGVGPGRKTFLGQD